MSEGLVTASGVRIRAARAEDVAAARRLIALTGSGVILEDRLSAAVSDGTLGAAVRKGLSGGEDALTYELASAMSQEGEGTVEGLLVGADMRAGRRAPGGRGGGRAAGAAAARVLSHAGLPEMESVFGLLQIIKLKAVAVDPAHRSSGVAAALIAACRQLYTQLGYTLLYGQFEVGSGLETYYRSSASRCCPRDRASA
ncbi:hypothetical protein ACFQY7_20540 [Actinomadura luteofluorescens]|uniref:hypothetical protein n=1 Tax=Actinomadura luteofluorescens TaxID=46163 RepID=UPI00362588AB